MCFSTFYCFVVKYAYKIWCFCLSYTGDRGRSRKKKRDFFGAMRTRFNRSKFRSKSIDAGQHDAARSLGQARSISADGTRNSSEPSVGERIFIFFSLP